MSINRYVPEFIKKALQDHEQNQCILLSAKQLAVNV